LTHSHGVHTAGFHFLAGARFFFTANCRWGSGGGDGRRRISNARKNVSSGNRSAFAQENRVCGVLSMPAFEHMARTMRVPDMVPQPR
jgi:hypothetical protein